MHILYAEDEKFQREEVTIGLQLRGHSVVAVESGDELLEALAKDTFDAILTDDQMPPGKSGIEALSDIWGDPRYADIRRVVWSGTAAADKAAAVGAKFVPKRAPFVEVLEALS